MTMKQSMFWITWASTGGRSSRSSSGASFAQAELTPDDSREMRGMA